MVDSAGLFTYLFTSKIMLVSSKNNFHYFRNWGYMCHLSSSDKRYWFPAALLAFSKHFLDSHCSQLDHKHPLTREHRLPLARLAHPLNEENPSCCVATTQRKKSWRNIESQLSEDKCLLSEYQLLSMNNFIFLGTALLLISDLINNCWINSLPKSSNYVLLIFLSTKAHFLLHI